MHALLTDKSHIHSFNHRSLHAVARNLPYCCRWSPTNPVLRVRPTFEGKVSYFATLTSCRVELLGVQIPVVFQIADGWAVFVNVVCDIMRGVLFDKVQDILA